MLLPNDSRLLCESRQVTRCAAAMPSNVGRRMTLVSYGRRFVRKKLGMRDQMLSDEQWSHIQPLLPKRRSQGRPWANDRLVLEGILWVLRTGARWKDLPDPYPSPATCWRRLRLWEEEGIWLK